MTEITVNAAKIARLAYGYELMFRAIAEIAGTSGGSTQWFTQMGIEVQKRVDPLWKLLEDSNDPKPGDCLSQHVPFAEWAAHTERKAEALEHWRQEVGKLHSQIATLTEEQDRIERNRDMWKGQVERQAEQIQEMREALRPFAKVAALDIGEDEVDADLFRPMTQHNHAPRLTVGDLRKARAVFGGSSDA